MNRRYWKKNLSILLTVGVFIGSVPQNIYGASDIGEVSDVIESVNDDEGEELESQENSSPQESQPEQEEQTGNDNEGTQVEKEASDGTEQDDNITIENEDESETEEDEESTEITGEENTEDTDEENTSEPEPLLENSWRYHNGERIDFPSVLADNDAWEKVNGNYVNNLGEVIVGAIGRAIDVSHHNGVIDWETVQQQDISFVIIRCGYGTDVASQDDRQWLYNVTECERLGIPYGVYLYSYATSAEAAKKEADHVLRLLKGHNPSYPVFYDLEDNTLLELENRKTVLGDIAEAFCDRISQAGYEVGIYSSTYWYNTYLTDSRFNQWTKWVAQYNSVCKYTGKYVMWQCTSQYQMPGITGNVDLSMCYSGILPDIRLVTQNGQVYCYSGETQLYGEQIVNGISYYFEPETGQMVTDWVDLDGRYVYYNSDGKKVYGEKKIDGYWYYFQEKTGVMATGWVDLPTKRVYYDSNGHMVYGEKRIDGYWYYFHPVTGAMKTGWQDLPTKRVYYDGNGHMVYGEKKINGYWYYFHPVTGAMKTGWQDLSTKRVYYDNNGHMVYGEKKINGYWYYFHTVTGAMTTGWVDLPSKRVYYDSNGHMVYGSQTIGGVVYNFNSVTGALQNSSLLVNYKTTSNVNYRIGPGTSYAKAGALKKGVTVKVVSGYSQKANNYTWYRILLNNKYYYVASSYLKKV